MPDTAVYVNVGELRLNQPTFLLIPFLRDCRMSIRVASISSSALDEVHLWQIIFKLIMADLDVDVEYIEYPSPVNYSMLFDLVADGTYAALAMACAITDKRSTMFNFTLVVFSCKLL